MLVTPRGGTGIQSAYSDVQRPPRVPFPTCSLLLCSPCREPTLPPPDCSGGLPYPRGRLWQPEASRRPRRYPRRGHCRLLGASGGAPTPHDRSRLSRRQPAVVVARVFLLSLACGRSRLLCQRVVRPSCRATRWAFSVEG